MCRIAVKAELKPYALLPAILLVCGVARAQSAITVTINNVRSSGGVCSIALYSDPSSFLDPRKATMRKIVKAVKGKVNTRFDHILPGTYAIAVIHDENNDDKLNTNFIGIPKEGYGASNNNLPMTSAPKFSSSSFSVAGGEKVLDIDLKYY